jgi:hypothetical protein
MQSYDSAYGFGGRLLSVIDALSLARRHLLAMSKRSLALQEPDTLRHSIVVPASRAHVSIGTRPPAHFCSYPYYAIPH